MKKAFIKLSQILAIVIILLFIINCIPTFFWWDDFAFFLSVKNHDIIPILYDQYFNYDGRFLTPIAFIQHALIKYFNNAPLITFFWVISFISSISIIATFYCKKKETLVILIGLLASSYLILFKTHISQTVYWSVGGIYSLGFFFGVLWLFFYNKRQDALVLDGTNKAQYYKYFFITCILVGLTSQNLSICAVTIILFDLLFSKKEKKRELLIGLLLVIPGIVFLSLAPGNSIRSGIPPSLSIYTFSFENIYRIYSTPFLMSKWAFFLSPICSLFIFVYGDFRQKKLVGYSLKYFMASIASPFPFLFFEKSVSSGRIYIYFQVFFLISLIYLWIFIFSSLNTKTKKNFISQKLKYLAQFSTVLLLLGASYILYSNFIYGLDIKKSMDIRNNYIQQEKLNGKKVIEVKKINSSKTWGYKVFMHEFSDIMDDPMYTVEKSAAEYYGIDSLIIK